jgi:esterase/lipase superfamily enzyme
MRNPVLTLSFLLLAACSSSPAIDDRSVAVVPILYATDRAATGSERANDSYGATPGQLTFGAAEVSIPNGHQLGATETPKLMKIEIWEDPARHVMLRSVAPISKEELGSALRDRLRGSQERSILIFVHGYNVEFAKAARRTAQIAHDLNWRGVAVLYSWASGGRAAEYLADGRNAQQTSSHLAAVLTLLAQESEVETVHVLAHSIGALPTLMALKELAADPQGSASPLLGELILAAPDVDAGQFRTMVATAAAMADRVTVYVSRRDEALQLSSSLHSAVRAGDGENGIVAIPGVDTIDASAVDGSFLGHSYYGANRAVLADVFSLLTTRAPPDRRFGLQPAAEDGQPYWILRP